MIEYTVEHDLDIMVMEFFADGFEILVCPQTAVDLHKIPCVISMVVGFKDRIQDNGADPQLLEILCPFADL